MWWTIVIVLLVWIVLACLLGLAAGQFIAYGARLDADKFRNADRWRG